MSSLSSVTRSLVRLSTRQFSSAASTGLPGGLAFKKYELPSLSYDYAALEPFISAKIMETHHSKHHQAYVNNLNAAIEQFHEAQHKGDLMKQIALQGALRFNGGGHLNHSIFWTNLTAPKNGGGAPPSATSDISKYITKDFGSVDKLKSDLSAASLAIQGSGWGWLGYNATKDRIEILTKPNQDPLTELIPLLGIDVWEHAYYYLYGPLRAKYLEAIWNVVNWQNVEERLIAAKKK